MEEEEREAGEVGKAVRGPVPGFVQRALPRIEAAFGVSAIRTDAGDLAPPLGFGNFGVVFALQDGRVLKITRDDAEAVVGSQIEAWQRAKDAPLHEAAVRACVRIDGIRRVSAGRDALFAMVREAVTPFSGGEGHLVEVASVLHANFDAWREWIRFRNGDRKRPKGVPVQVWSAAADLTSSPDLERFAALYVGLWDLGIPLMDTSIQNFGARDDGEVVIFDFGGSYPLRPSDGISTFEGRPFRAYPWASSIARVPAL